MRPPPAGTAAAATAWPCARRSPAPARAHTRRSYIPIDGIDILVTPAEGPQQQQSPLSGSHAIERQVRAPVTSTCVRAQGAPMSLLMVLIANTPAEGPHQQPRQLSVVHAAGQTRRRRQRRCSCTCLRSITRLQMVQTGHTVTGWAVHQQQTIGSPIGASQPAPLTACYALEP